MVLVALAPVLLLAGETLRVATAETLADSQKIPRIRWSLRIDPQNARLYHQLGMLSYSNAVSLASAEKAGSTEAIELLKKSLELDPHQASYWTDLATVCDALHQDCAGPALEHALAADPMRPRLRWLAGNYYLRDGQTDVALSHFQRLLALDASYAADTFRICSRVLANPETVLERILPRDAAATLKLAYVNTLVGEGQISAAYQVWARTVNGVSRFPFTQAQPLLEGLIAHGQIKEAEGVWLNLQKLGIVREENDQSNRVYNGDFERLPLNAGFDWRYLEVPYLSLDFAEASPYRGSRCLRMDFTVARNEEYEPVFQYVPVLPNRSYVLSAYVRSEEITSDSGPRLRVADAACESCLNASGDGTVATTSWHPVKLSFTTTPSTMVVKVSVWRPRGQTYPMTISGKFWLDSVSLEAEMPESTAPK